MDSFTSTYKAQLATLTEWARLELDSLRSKLFIHQKNSELAAGLLTEVTRKVDAYVYAWESGARADKIRDVIRKGQSDGRGYANIQIIDSDREGRYFVQDDKDLMKGIHRFTFIDKTSARQSTVALEMPTKWLGHMDGDDIVRVFGLKRRELPFYYDYETDNLMAGDLVKRLMQTTAEQLGATIKALADQDNIEETHRIIYSPKPLNAIGAAKRMLKDLRGADARWGDIMIQAQQARSSLDRAEKAIEDMREHPLDLVPTSQSFASGIKWIKYIR